jgi:hypothetical protein
MVGLPKQQNLMAVSSLVSSSLRTPIAAAQTIETATRLPLPQQAPAADGAPHQKQHLGSQLELAATPFSLTSAAVSFSWQGMSYGMTGVRPAGDLDALSAVPANRQLLEDPTWSPRSPTKWAAP